MAVLLLAFPSAMRAQNSWNGGGGDNNWGTGANWVGGAPTPGTTSDIAFAGTTRTNPFNNYTAYDDFRNVLFASGAGTFSVTGNAIDLFGKIENNSADAQTFALTIGTGPVSGGYIEINPVAGNLNINSTDIFLGNNQLRVWGDNGKTLAFGNGTTISGSGGSVAINQNSTVVYQSAHTYTGGTFVNAGVLRFNSGGSADSSAISLGDTSGSAPSALQVASGVTLGGGTLTVRSGSSGAATLGYTESSGTGAVSRDITLSKNLALDVASGGTLQISGAVSSTGSLIKTGGGTATLSGANTFTGSTTINGGTLSINAVGRLGTAPGSATPGHLTMDGGTLLYTGASAALSANRGIALGASGGTMEVTSGTTLTYDGIIAGGGALAKTGAGELLVGGVNTYTGLTTVSAGTLRVTNASGLGATSAGTTVVSGASLYLGRTNTSYDAEPITINGAGFGGTNGALRLANNATNNGLITLASDSTIRSESFALIAAGITNASGTQSLTVDAATGILSISNVGIGLGSGGLTKTGGGTLRVYTSNNYTGATTVSAGVLSFFNKDSLGSTDAATTVASGASVTISGALQVAESFFINGGGNGTSGALHGSSGSSMLTGLVTLQSDATISVAGTLTLTNSGGITGNNFNLTFNSQNTGVNRVVSDITLGSGGVIKSNTGTLLLAGTNTYTGTTTVQGGTLILSNGSAINDAAAVSLDDTAGVTLVVTNSETIGSLRGGGSTGGNVSIGAGRTLTVAETGSQTYAGVISNSGALAKSGAGTTILSGANTYTGATTISAGTLQVGNGGTSGSIGSTSGVNNGATLAYNRSDNLTASYAISGGGNVTKSGAGTLTVSGANSYSGGTLVSAGALKGDTTSLQGAITNNAAAIFDTATNGTYAGAMSGSGALTKSGGGILTLTGNNGYSGTTTISAGTLQVGNGGTSGSIGSTSGVNNGATLAYNRSDNLSASYAITGSGNLTKSGAGTLTLTGINSYSGGTLVSAGALKGDTTSLQGAITNNAATIFDTATNGTYAGVMSGTGTLAKSGAATLTLTATNSYNGATAVDAGKLVVNGAISNSAVTVQSNAVLGGGGSVGSTIIANGATIAPGNSPGTLTINGDLTWNNGGNYDWEVLKLPSAGVAGTDWDLLSVAGSLNLTNLTGAPLFNINLYSGALAGWSTTGTYAWKILEAGNAIANFNTNYFGINTNNFANDISGGLFAIELLNGGKDLYLTYSSSQPIPEPGTWGAAALLAACAGFLRWRKWRRS